MFKQQDLCTVKSCYFTAPKVMQSFKTSSNENNINTDNQRFNSYHCLYAAAKH